MPRKTVSVHNDDYWIGLATSILVPQARARRLETQLDSWDAFDRLDPALFRHDRWTSKFTSNVVEEKIRVLANGAQVVCAPPPEPRPDTRVCRCCDGRGWTLHDRAAAPRFRDSGDAWKQRCVRCEGGGRVPRDAMLPPGVRHEDFLEGVGVDEHEAAF